MRNIWSYILYQIEEGVLVAFALLDYLAIKVDDAIVALQYTPWLKVAYIGVGLFIGYIVFFY